MASGKNASVGRTKFNLKQMKKLIEHKELDAATFDNSRLPLRNCLFSDDEKPNWPNNGGSFSLLGVCHSSDKLKFKDSNYLYWNKCAEVIERYPRDVPEGVTELPTDKPQLAYTGRLKAYEIDEDADFIYLEDPHHHQGWVKISERFVSAYFFYHIAIDVSTAWADKNFPKIVEAMEYKPIYGSRIVPEGVKRNLIGHKLGDKIYDLDWNKLKSEKNLELTPDDVFGSENQIVDDNKKVEEEPPDYLKYDNKEVSCLEPPRWRKDYFEAGKARGKWEECQRWKGEVSKFFNNDYKDWYGNSDEELPTIVRQALEDRQLREEIAYTHGAQWKYKTVEDYFKANGYDFCTEESQTVHYLACNAFNAAREIREVK